MHAIAAGGAQAAESAKVIIVLVAVMLVAFWRAIARIVLALIAIAILVTLGTGLVELMRIMHAAH
jgi:hypothetical protein